MNDFSKFMKKTEEAKELIREAAQIVISDSNTEEYLIEGNYYAYDSDDEAVDTVLNFIRKYHF